MASLNKEYWLPATAYLISAQFFMGGIVRLSPFPFRKEHEDVCIKNKEVAPLVYPVVPFKDVTWHNSWVSACMLTASGLLAYPLTRGKWYTLGVVWYLTGCLAYSHWKLSLNVWLPVTNATLASLIWWFHPENQV